MFISACCIGFSDVSVVTYSDLVDENEAVVSHHLLSFYLHGDPGQWQGLHTQLGLIFNAAGRRLLERQGQRNPRRVFTWRVVAHLAHPGGTGVHVGAELAHPLGKHKVRWIVVFKNTNYSHISGIWKIKMTWKLRRQQWDKPLLRSQTETLGWTAPVRRAAVWPDEGAHTPHRGCCCLDSQPCSSYTATLRDRTQHITLFPCIKTMFCLYIFIFQESFSNNMLYISFPRLN